MLSAAVIMPLPNLIIIGAQKSGTSSLHYYLDLHPEIAMSKLKELDFFSREERWRRGVDWYARQFRDAPVRGEASPSYTSYPTYDSVPERISEVVPAARLVYLVRDPIDRIVSAWRMGPSMRVDRRSSDFEDLDSLAVGGVATRCSSKRYLSHFREEQIMVVDADELRRDRVETMRRVFRFAGVDDSSTSVRFVEEANVTDAPVVTPVGRTLMLALHRTIGPALTRRIGRRLPAGKGRLAQQALKPPVLDPATRERLVEHLAPRPNGCAGLRATVSRAGRV